ncbi:ABC transporter ATP-binding protein [Leadbettera azotonutricia]|uniref:ABC transporter, carbohydrate uptake transporter-1 (CUT1) family, ATP-binding protein n=1 Tax=Leadbettera azotonutricia (strain ATCC BAA-888 / DSM 13862 / ZAS-9) TaxID=545695 RepID=F5Y9E9_LEAAZ|nr:sn-glycerol-3-phosphate ABC transporter ATP-binding protein UgpC [Leadbettera azotonutricia]AEF82568.1 ABC transporter, carbohydrate uptake transporter-1 (CUT1) family, ATP-binding protein [Leadbettera azotonutricia ZAS-9]
MAAITLKNVGKTYPGDIIAVNNFNLEIQDKEFIIFVGPSGCGKSTTIRMIAGLEEINQGEIYIGGKLVNQLEPKDRNIAMVFQNYALFPHMTVYRNIAFGLIQQKVPKDEIKQKVENAARILGITQLLDRKPKALSGGERQRVALGRAIVRDPAVFLLDEPLSNLDAKLRTTMRSEISKLHKKLGTTFIYVTHDQIEAMTMGDRIVVMKSGIIQQVDTPRKLYNNPCNLFVAGFIGSPPMNMLPGIITDKNGEYGVKIYTVFYPLPTARFPRSVLEKYSGKNVIAGIRPEDLHPEFMLEGEADPDTGAPVVFPSEMLQAELELAEMMGADTYLNARIEDKNVISRIPSALQYREKKTIGLLPDISRLFLFDPDTEKNILL